MQDWKKGVTDQNHKCKLCKRTMGTHNSTNGSCVLGKKTAYPNFSKTDFFTPSDRTPKKKEGHIVL